MHSGPDMAHVDGRGSELFLGTRVHAAARVPSGDWDPWSSHSFHSCPPLSTPRGLGGPWTSPCQLQGPSVPPLLWSQARSRLAWGGGILAYGLESHLEMLGIRDAIAHLLPTAATICSRFV